MKEHIYMLAIMPPTELAQDIRNIQLEIGRKYDTKEAIKRPVHITLVPPYKATAETEETIINEMTEWAALQIPFPVTLENYGVFRNRSPVLYISVARNDLLQLFHKDLDRKVRQVLPGTDIRKNMPFHPHVTVGFKDLSPEQFVHAEREYNNKEFFSTFVVDHFYFWKHNGSNWEVQADFEIGTRCT